jgi:PAS domain S-box-containing protein
MTDDEDHADERGRTDGDRSKTDRRLAEVLFEEAQDMLFVVDSREGSFVVRRVNEAYERATGLSEDRMCGRTPRELFGEERGREIEHAYRRCLDRHEPLQYEETLHEDQVPNRQSVTGDGLIHFETRIAPVEGNDGIDWIVGATRNVDDRKRRERRLERLNTQYRTLIDNFPEGGIFLFDEDCRFEQAGGMGLSAVGLSAEEVTGATPHDLFPRSIADELVDNFRATLSGDQREFEQRYDDDHYRIRTMPIRSDGDVVAGMSISQNITERRAYERKVTALHRVADDLATTESSEAVFERTVKASEEILAFDRCIALAHRQDDVLGVAATSEGVDADERSNMPVENGLAGRTYRTGESFLVDDLRTSESADPQGPYRSGISVPVGEYGVLQVAAGAVGAFDESDRRLTELLAGHAESALDRIARERRLEHQKERLEEYANVVAHDIRNPLEIAKGHLEVGRARLEAEAEARGEGRSEGEGEDTDADTGASDPGGHLDEVATGLDRIEALTADLLTLARQGEQSVDVESVALDDVTRRCWNGVVAPNTGLIVETDRTVVAEPSRLKQLLENLFHNAVEHGGPGVTVTVGDLPGGFYVADDGSGLPEGKHEAVFEAGYSTVQRGTGLGLRIVDEVAAVHGWEVVATDSDDGGARFEITGVETR